MRKHLALGVAIASTQLCAECMTCIPRSPCEVFLSTPVHTYEFRANALLLQPTSNNLHYAVEAVPLPLASPSWNVYEIHTDYHWGFDVGIRSIFHCTNTNLTLNWQRFHARDRSSKQVCTSNMIGPFFEIGPDATPYGEALGKVAFRFDAVNLDYGIFINFGDRLETNLFSGIGFAYIKQKRFSKFSNLDETIVRTIDVPSTFIGAGPQFGLEFSYCIARGFHFTGEALATFLVGTLKNQTTYEALSPALVAAGVLPPNEQFTHVDKKTQVVPGIEGKLGLSYVFSFCNCYMLHIEAGYQAQLYINAIQSVDIGSEVITPPVLPDTVGVFARTFEQSLSNFGLAGPYFRLDIGF